MYWLRTEEQQASRRGERKRQKESKIFAHWRTGWLAGSVFDYQSVGVCWRVRTQKSISITDKQTSMNVNNNLIMAVLNLVNVKSRWRVAFNTYAMHTSGYVWEREREQFHCDSHSSLSIKIAVRQNENRWTNVRAQFHRIAFVIVTRPEKLWCDAESIMKYYKNMFMIVALQWTDVCSSVHFFMSTVLRLRPDHISIAYKFARVKRAARSNRNWRLYETTCVHRT